MARAFFRSEILLEVAISHHFESQIGVDISILDYLVCPAVESVGIREIISNYSESGIPMDFLQTIFVKNDEQIHGGG